MIEVYQQNPNLKTKGSPSAMSSSFGSINRLDGDVGRPQKLRAAIYVRKSVESEEGRSKSLIQQLAHCRMVAERLGIAEEDITVYTEEEGTKGDWYWKDEAGLNPAPHRVELSKLIIDILLGKIDIIIAWRSDRVYRDVGVCDALLKVLRANGVRLFMGTREYDLNSSSGKFSASIEAANNQRWRDQISEDITRDHLSKAEWGMFSRNPSCLGYRSKGRGTQEAEPIFDELDLVLRVFRLFVDGLDIAVGEQVGPMGSYGVARYLMDQGVKWPKGSKGHMSTKPDVIHESQVNRALTNCMYIGRWRHAGLEYQCDKLLVPERDLNGQMIPGGKKVTAIPIALYEAAQLKLSEQLGKCGKRNRGSEHMLTGLAVCARCGRPLTVHFTAYKSANGKNRREPRRNYYCNHKRGHRPCPPGSARRVQEDVLNQWVLTELAPLLVLEIQQRSAAAGREADREALASAKSRLKELRDKETKKLTYMMDAMDMEQFRSVAQALRAERETIERQVSELERKTVSQELPLPALTDPEVLKSMKTAALKDAIGRAVEWIAVSKEGVTVLTRWGSFFGARFRKAMTDEGETLNVAHIDKLDALSCFDCIDWISDPDEFIQGRRDWLGKRGVTLTDEDILPGCSSEGLLEEQHTNIESEDSHKAA